MHPNAGDTVDFAHAALTSSNNWEAPREGLRPSHDAPPVAEDWTGLERIEAVVARQRRYLVRDAIAAVAFVGLSVAVIVALR